LQLRAHSNPWLFCFKIARTELIKPAISAEAQADRLAVSDIGG
jgi:hypothetical protein